MADISYTAAQVRPLIGATIRRLESAATLSVGHAVYIDSAGRAQKADANTAVASQARGIVVAVSTTGSTTANVGDPVDVVTHGPVELGASGMASGGALFISITAGALDQTAPGTTGKFKYVLGYALSASAVYVQGQLVVPTANP